MQKYYLVIFNEDYADEHDVPAIQCFSEVEYQKWLNTPSGPLNPNYEEQIAEYNAKVEKQKAWTVEVQKRGLWSKNSKDYTKEEAKWMRENPSVYVSGRDKPKKVKSLLHARLGNSGECFEEGYEQYYLFKEFVEAKVVEVHEVNENFHEIFHQARIDRLSLCNIFDTDQFGGEGEFDEEY